MVIYYKCVVTNLVILVVGGIELKEVRVNLEKIKLLRKQANISVEEMSRYLGYESSNGYYYLESGRSKFPADTLATVAKIINTDIRHLFL